MFAEGRTLEDAGRWAQALDLFQQIAKVKMTPQVRFHIALCMENVGLLTQALEGYAVSAREAETTAPDVVQEAHEHIEALEKRIPILTVEIIGTGAQDELFVDGRRIPRELPSMTMRVDPGPHTIEIRRGDRVVGEEHVVLQPGSSRRVAIKTDTPVKDKTDTPVKERGSDGRTQRILGFATLGAGAAAAIGTGVFIGLRAGALKDLEARCPGLAGCDRSVEPIVGNGRTYATLVNVMASLTGAFIVGGTVIVLTAPPASAPPAPRARHSVHFSVAATPHAAGIAVGGSF